MLIIDFGLTVNNRAVLEITISDLLLHEIFYFCTSPDPQTSTKIDCHYVMAAFMLLVTIEAAVKNLFAHIWNFQFFP